jgi:peptidoglycan/LPS O-acetylase OafA/YrhL
MSYSYYLIHGLTLHGLVLAFSRIWPQQQNSSALFWFILPVAFLLTIVASTLLFLAVEKPYSMARTTPSPGEFSSRSNGALVQVR